MDKSELIRVNFVIEKDALADLDYFCKRRGLSRSSALRFAISELLKDKARTDVGVMATGVNPTTFKEETTVREVSA